MNHSFFSITPQGSDANLENWRRCARTRHSMAEAMPGVGFAAIVSPFRTHRTRLEFAPGLLISEMMAATGIGPDTPARVFLGGCLVADAERATTRPRPGDIVTVRVIPAGHGKNPLEMVLEIGVMLAASALTAGFADAVLLPASIASISLLSAGSATLTVGEAVGAVACAALSVVGKAEVQSLFPASGSTNLPKIQSTPASYSVSGTQNAVAPFAVIPKVYGQRRAYPMLAAPAFTEPFGKSHTELYLNEYLLMLVVLGYGPLDITQIKIGDTAIEDYEDVEWEVRAGYPDDAPPSLYTGAVEEASLNEQLVVSANPPQLQGWKQATTGAGADEIALQITWPEGFWEVNNVGNDHGEAMLIQVQYRLHGSSGS